MRARGGRGIPVRAAHTDEAQVRALFERVAAEQGRLDLLVNNIWGGYVGYFEAEFDAPLGSKLRRWEGMFATGVRAPHSQRPGSPADDRAA
jgi:NAD(P)-dependent dehydrogenase (short-subunit alcohol dehydrogenase family)